MQQEKPGGVDLLGILMVISGMFEVFSGIDALGFAAFLATVAPINTAIPGTVGGAVADYAAIWGSIILAIGIGSFIVAYGVFYGRSWGWSGAVALAIIGIVIPIMNIIAGYWPSIITVAFSSVILYYLSRPQVRAYFGRTVSAPSGAAAA
jgi:hypothetical protein